MQEKIKELQEYVNLIESDNLKKCCEFIISENIEQLRLPSSSTGLNHQHNNDELKEWGQLLHTKKVVQTCLNSARRYDLNTYRCVDIIIAMALLHDLPYKFDLTLTTTSKMNKNHALDNAKYIEQKLIDFKCYGYIHIISDAIAFHMGKWNDYSDGWYDEFETNKEEDIYIKILREGDYFASRKDIGVDVDIETCKLLISQIKSDIDNPRFMNFKTYKCANKE